MTGYITTTTNWHYVLITDKRKITVRMIESFINAIANNQNIPFEKVDAVLRDRKSIAEMRKRIVPCRIDSIEIDGKPFYHIEAGKDIDKPSMFGNWKSESVITFTEENDTMLRRVIK